ncbi:MAG TPA: hypothetical protein VGI92_04385 [Gemmatimonadales bacterium]|jgi:hypothetical protein
MRAGFFLLLAWAGFGASSPLAAQGPLRIGPILTWGTDVHAGFGAGMAMRTGHLRIGARWTWQSGQTQTEGPYYTIDYTFNQERRSRVQLATLDLAVVIPFTTLSVEPGVGIGALIASQRIRELDTSTGAERLSDTWHSSGLVLTPGFAINFYRGSLRITPDVRLLIASKPRTPYVTPSSGILMSVQISPVFGRRG